MTRPIALATTAIVAAIALATAALLLGPGWLEQRRVDSMPLCIGQMSQKQADEMGCKR